MNTKAPYGYCPICRCEGQMRERGINGNDRCHAGHTYPSTTALKRNEAPLLQDSDRALSKALAATPEAYRRPQSHANPDADKKPSAGAVLQSHGDAPAVPAAPVPVQLEFLRSRTCGDIVETMYKLRSDKAGPLTLYAAPTAGATAAPAEQASDNFLRGVCVALQTIKGTCGVAWREIVQAVGVDDMLNYAAFVEPEEWELAGFNRFAESELGRKKPKHRKAAAAAPAAPVQALPEIAWPKANDVGRLEDMSPTGHMRVGIDESGDAYVAVFDGENMASVEFCVPGSGGGRSSHTRMALIALMVAMEADNAERPDLDWWALRGVTAADKGGA